MSPFTCLCYHYVCSIFFFFVSVSGIYLFFFLSCRLHDFIDIDFFIVHFWMKRRNQMKTEIWNRVCTTVHTCIQLNLCIVIWSLFVSFALFIRCAYRMCVLNFGLGSAVCRPPFLIVCTRSKVVSRFFYATSFLRQFDLVSCLYLFLLYMYTFFFQHMTWELSFEAFLWNRPPQMKKTTSATSTSTTVIS